MGRPCPVKNMQIAIDLDLVYDNVAIKWICLEFRESGLFCNFTTVQKTCLHVTLGQSPLVFQQIGKTNRLNVPVLKKLLQ